MSTWLQTMAILPVLLALGGSDAPGQSGTRGLPDGETVLKNIEARWLPIKDYAVTLAVTADIEKLDVPPMVVRMYFKQPDKTHFESEGFAVLPRDALRFNPRVLREKYAVEAVSRDSSSASLRLKLISRGETGPARRLTLLVDPKDLTIDGLESGTADGRRMKAVFTYAPTGGFLLPSSLVVEFASDAPAEAPETPQSPGRPRKGKVTVIFTDYRVNSGLSDDLFLKKEP
jgi:hypothetical protein